MKNTNGHIFDVDIAPSIGVWGVDPPKREIFLPAVAVVVVLVVLLVVALEVVVLVVVVVVVVVLVVFSSSR